uniref:Uncharacterized protein n=1 Tax=Globodera rostochiensis TaxID=31243 RepID=A0A914GR81_GLORO
MSLSHPTSSHPSSPPRKMAKKDEAGLDTRMTEQQEEYATATTLPPVMPARDDVFSSIPVFIPPNFVSPNFPTPKNGKEGCRWP